MTNFVLIWLGYGCPDIRSNTILRVSARVLLDWISIWISSLSKADCFPQCERASHNPTKAWTEQDFLWGRENSFCPATFKLGQGLLPAFRFEPKHHLFLGFEPSGLLTGTYTIGSSCSQVLRTQTRTYIIGSPGSPVCRLTLQIFGFAGFLIMWAINLFINILIYRHTHKSYWFCFSGDPQYNQQEYVQF